jgi:DNA-binding transcriptional regulator YhcF (GntR family)
VIVTVDPASPIPPYEQLRAAIVELIVTEQLSIGARLPTVRQLAADLNLAPGTVARAFRELENDGIITSRGRHGTHVRALPPRPPAAERRKRLAEAARTYAVTARELGVEAESALAEVATALGAM